MAGWKIQVYHLFNGKLHVSKVLVPLLCLFTRHHVRLVFSKRKIKFGVRPNDQTHLLSKVIFMFTGILYLMTKFWNFQRLKNVINHNTSNLLKKKLRTTSTFARTPDKFKAWSQVQEVFLALQESFLEILHHPQHFKPKKEFVFSLFSGNEKSMDFCC